jgi:hypothetical protein
MKETWHALRVNGKIVDLHQSRDRAIAAFGRMLPLGGGMDPHDLANGPILIDIVPVKITLPRRPSSRKRNGASKDPSKVKGGHARAAALPPAQRIEIARKAAEIRWSRK